MVVGQVELLDRLPVPLAFAASKTRELRRCLNLCETHWHTEGIHANMCSIGGSSMGWSLPTGSAASSNSAPSGRTGRVSTGALLPGRSNLMTDWTPCGTGLSARSLQQRPGRPVYCGGEA